MTHQPVPTLRTLADALVEAAKLNQGLYFVHSNDNTEFFSYESLLRKSLHVLYNMKEHGINKGDKVIIHVYDNSDFIVVFWACVLGGIVAIPLSNSKTKESQAKLINVLGQHDKCFVIGSGTKPEFEGHFSWFAVEELQKDLKKQAEITQICSDDVAYIQYSSGSTGDPKGVILTHENLDTNLKAIIACSELSQSDSCIGWLPLSHDMGLIGLHLTSLYSGIDQFVIQTELFIRRPQIWLSIIDKYRVTVTLTSNFGCKYLLSAIEATTQSYDLSCVRLIYNGSEPISAEVCDQFLEKLASFKLDRNSMFPVYGLAEASLAVTFPKPGTLYKKISLARNQLKLGQQINVVSNDFENKVDFVVTGTPVNNCEVRLCDENHHVLGELVIGNIQIRGKNVTKGYFLSDQNKTLITEDGWLCTGDLGCIVNSELIITGRKKDLIIVNGQNYYPHDIEQELIRTFSLETGKVVITSLDIPERETTILVFIAEKRTQNDFSQLANMIKDSVAFMIGAGKCEVIPIRSIPKTSSGKVKRFSLVEEYSSGKYNDIIESINKDSLAFAEKENDIHSLDLHLAKKAVLDFLQDEINGILNSEIVFISDLPLLEYGLSSKDLMFIKGRIIRKTGVKIDSSVFFEHTTLNSLSEHIVNCLKSSQKKDEEMEIPSLQFPEDFFNSNTISKQFSSFKLDLDIKECFSEGENADPFFVLMNLFVEVLHNITKEDLMKIQFMHQIANTIQSIDFDFKGQNKETDETLLVYEAIKNKGIKKVIEVNDLEKINLRKGEREVKLLFVHYDTDIEFSGLKRIYDLILKTIVFEEKITIVAEFNNLLSKDRIRSLLSELSDKFDIYIQKITLNKKSQIHS